MHSYRGLTFDLDNVIPSLLKKAVLKRLVVGTFLGYCKKAKRPPNMPLAIVGKPTKL